MFLDKLAIIWQKVGNFGDYLAIIEEGWVR